MLRTTRKLITQENSKSPVSEAYKVLRTNIQFSSIENSVKVILVASSGPAEGKSTTAANMAVTMAQSDQRVLLLDADLRKPVQHRLFDLPNSKGLTNILVENIDYKDLLYQIEIDNLEIITSGPKPPNPSELLGSKKMKELLDLLRESYDVIIIDTPPILPVTDATVLSTYVDGVVLVAAYGQATYEAVGHAKALLEKVNAKILGVLINKVPASENGGYYYYYYYYEDSDYKNKTSKKKKRKERREKRKERRKKERLKTK